MTKSRFFRSAGVTTLLAVALGTLGCQLDPSVSASQQPAAQEAPPPAPDTSQLVIDTVSLPTTYPRADYSVQFQGHGGVPPFQWRVEKGELPPGLRLERDGTLHGSPEKVGDYRFTISLTDSNKPPQAVQREYVLNVVEALAMTWKVPAHVAGNRIDGSVEVSNTTPEDFDFTFIVLAVNENGRATAIGYQHFVLKPKTTGFEIPFGDTLPHGAYVVHVDGVAEVPKTNQIHRVRLQTPAPLQVSVGP